MFDFIQIFWFLTVLTDNRKTNKIECVSTKGDYHNKAHVDLSVLGGWVGWVEGDDT